MVLPSQQTGGHPKLIPLPLMGGIPMLQLQLEPPQPRAPTALLGATDQQPEHLATAAGAGCIFNCRSGGCCLCLRRPSSAAHWGGRGRGATHCGPHATCCCIWSSKCCCSCRCSRGCRCRSGRTCSPHLRTRRCAKAQPTGVAEVQPAAEVVARAGAATDASASAFADATTAALPTCPSHPAAPEDAVVQHARSSAEAQPTRGAAAAVQPDGKAAAAAQPPGGPAATVDACASS